MATLAFIGGLGVGEVLVIGLVALLLFGSRLPEVGRSLGRGLMEFKRGFSGIKDELDDINEDADQRVDQELARQKAEGRLETAAPAEVPPQEAPISRSDPEDFPSAPAEFPPRKESADTAGGEQPRQDPETKPVDGAK